MPTEPSAKVLQRSFERIALCLSGGGYRAAAFHLGSLDMLDELELLDNVKMFSTASGGTITAVAYVVSKIENNESFAEFFVRFKKFLETKNIVKEAIDRSCIALEADPNADVSFGRFAGEVYEEELLGKSKKNFGTLINAALNNPFEDLIFNATELNLGNSFRFRVKKNKKTGEFRVAISNRFFNISTAKNIAETIRLGDIVATSSCFPGVFDPIIFPDNFHFDDDMALVKKSLQSGFTGGISLPLMDGGVFDNQGVYSFLLSKNKNKDENKHEIEDDNDPGDAEDLPDLVVIADSNPLNKNLFPVPTPKRKIPFVPNCFTEQSIFDVIKNVAATLSWWVGFLKIGTVFLLLVSMVCLVSMGVFIFQNCHLVFQNVFTGIFTFIIPSLVFLSILLLSVIAVICLFQAKRIIPWAVAFIDRQNKLTLTGFPPFNIWSLVKKSSLPGLIRFAETRFSSTLALTTDLFLKRVRALGVDLIKEDDVIGPLVTFNYITDMRDYGDDPIWSECDPDIIPTYEMIGTAEKAGKYQTNLWCTTPREMEGVILAGQMSICYSLLRFLWAIWANENADPIKENKERKKHKLTPLPLPPGPNDQGNEYHKLYKEVMDKWKEFKSKKRKTYERV